MITLASKPRLAAKARLRRDRGASDDGALLLFPESGLILNRSAQAIVARCTGGETVAAIVDGLARAQEPRERDRIVHDVLAFLDALCRRGVLRDG